MPFRAGQRPGAASARRLFLLLPVTPGTGSILTGAADRGVGTHPPSDRPGRVSTSLKTGQHLRPHTTALPAAQIGPGRACKHAESSRQDGSDPARTRRHAPACRELCCARAPPSPPPVALLRTQAGETPAGAGVRERARTCPAPVTSAGRRPKRQRSARVRVVPGWLRAGRQMDPVGTAARGRPGLLAVCPAVFSEERYRPRTGRPGG
ncbi:hypothetical protein GCM10010277_85980 [Streptomyces longisporoflavus]|nr:hypothetical protein GCM10010277_85980 [Streptomyces longisporoflavus]